jgi:hypothetical protein
MAYLPVKVVAAEVFCDKISMHTPAIQPGEKLWRMLQDDWLPKDSSGNRTDILEAAFIGQVSLMRAALIDEHVVDGFPRARFQNHGIVELDADEIVKRTGCTFEFDNSEGYWPTNSHVVLRRSSGGKNLRATHPEVRALTTIANSNASRIVREPK